MRATDITALVSMALLLASTVRGQEIVLTPQQEATLNTCVDLTLS